jgi:hypothetical protein
MPLKRTGFILLIAGFALGYFALYSSETLFFLQSSVLHFLEHMQELWNQMPASAQIYLTAGALIFLAGLIMLILPRHRH